VTYYECGLPMKPMRAEIPPSEGREFCLSLCHDPGRTGCAIGDGGRPVAVAAEPVGLERVAGGLRVGPTGRRMTIVSSGACVRRNTRVGEMCGWRNMLRVF